MLNAKACRVSSSGFLASNAGPRSFLPAPFWARNIKLVSAANTAIFKKQSASDHDEIAFQSDDYAQKGQIICTNISASPLSRAMIKYQASLNTWKVYRNADTSSPEEQTTKQRTALALLREGLTQPSPSS